MLLEKANYKYDHEYLEKFFLKEYRLDTIENNYFKYIDFEYFISISEEEKRHIFSIIKKIDKIILKAYGFYFENLELNLPRFSPFLKFLNKKYPKNKHFVGRYDILIDVNGEYKFLETNANTPGLITEIYNISKLEKPHGYINQGYNYVKYTKRFFNKFKGKKIGILIPYSFADEDFLVGLDYFKMIGEIIGEQNVVLGDIFESNIVEERDFYLKGEKIDVVLSFFPLEFFLTDVDYADSFFNLINNGNCILYNPMESIVLQDKLLFTIIYENIQRFTQEEQGTIKKHIPFTTRVFQEDENKFLAKARFGRISRDVFLDNFYTNIGTSSKEFIFQEKIQSKLRTPEGDFLVLGGFTNYRNPICLIGRRGKNFITKDENTNIILVYTK